MFFRSLHDVKATEMGGQVKFKAEIDFDGREITRAYLYKLDLEQLLKVGCREITRAYLYKLDLEQLLKVGWGKITRAYLYKLDLEQLLKVGCREMYAHVCISADFPGLVQDLTIKNGRVKIVLWA